jgi:hypothetical protein
MLIMVFIKHKKFLLCVVIVRIVLGGFEKLCKGTNSFIMSVRLSIHMEVLGSTGRIFMKFYIRLFFEKLSRKFKIYYNRARIKEINVNTNIHFLCISLISS